MRRARCISRVITVTRFAWIAQRFLDKHNVLLCGGESQCKHVRVFKQMNEKCFASFLQGKNRRTLPTKSSIPIVATSIGNHVKRNLAHLLRVSRRGSKARREKRWHARHVQREVFARASPCSSGTSESREGRPCPVCTAAFLARAHFDPMRNFGLCGAAPTITIHATFNASM